MVLGHSEILSEIGNDVCSLAFAFCSIMVLYLVGMADDLIGIRYRAKFVIQILCGVMLIAGGVYINNLYGVLGIHAVPLWLGYPLTILIVVFIINAINLIDGIDGLASGLCSIACLFYGLTFFMLHQYVYAMLAFATLGVLVPFFYYNVFGNAKHGRKIFMGDTGSLTIGMMLCFLSLKLTMCGLDDNTGNVHPMVLAFSPLLVPCCDVVRVYLHRVRNGKNPFLPDKNHIHHKLLALGIKQRNTMIIIVSVSTIFILLNILLSLYLNVNWIVLGDILIWTLANIRLTKSIAQLQSEQKPTNKINKYEIRYILSLLTVAFLLGSCATPKVAYFTDLKRGTAEQVLNPLEIRIRPEDKISIQVNSKDPLLMNLSTFRSYPDRLVRHQVHPIVREYQDIQ